MKLSYIFLIFLCLSCKRQNNGFLENLSDEQRALIESASRLECLAELNQAKTEMKRETLVSMQKMQVGTSFTFELERTEDGDTDGFTEQVDLIARTSDANGVVLWFYVRQLSNQLQTYERFSTTTDTLTPFAANTTTEYLLKYTVADNHSLADQYIDAYCSSSVSVSSYGGTFFNYSYTLSGNSSNGDVYSITRSFELPYNRPVFFEKYFYKRKGTFRENESDTNTGDSDDNSSSSDDDDTSDVWVYDNAFIEYTDGQKIQIIADTLIAGHHCTFISAPDVDDIDGDMNTDELIDTRESISFDDYAPTVLGEGVTAMSYRLNCDNTFTASELGL